MEHKYRFPAEYEPHDGTLMIWPVRPGSWGRDTREAEKAFTKIILELLHSENVYLLAGKEVKEQVARLFREQEKNCEAEAQTIEGNCKTGTQASEEKCNTEAQTVEKNCKMEAQVAEKNCKPDIQGADVLLLYGHALYIIEIESDDAWARDVGPTYVVSEDRRKRAGINWSFNAWGGMVDGLYADWAKDDAVAKAFTAWHGDSCIDASPFVLEGGSIHSDGEGTLLVTEICLLSKGRNPDLSKEEIEQKLCDYLGAEKVIWLPRGIYMDETNEHVDNVAAFVGPAEVVLAWTDNPEDPQYELSKQDYEYLSQETDAKGRSFIIHKLPIPDVPVCCTMEEVLAYDFEPGEDEREEGERLAASYVNFYIANTSVLVPQFGGENEESDRRACEILQKCFPERKVVGIPARSILLGGGNIHCITQQVPEVLQDNRSDSIS